MTRPGIEPGSPGPLANTIELLKLCYHPWLAADEGRILHLLSHVV